MSITKDLTRAIPYEDTSNKVAKWVLEYTYENDSEDDATYYKSVFNEIVEQEDARGNVNFALQTKEEFSKADLVALCPVSRWDSVFASQVDSVITNPVIQPVADESFNIPS